MRRLSEQRKKRLRELALACLLSFSLMLSAVLIHFSREEGNVATFSPFAKPDKTILVLGLDAVGSNTDVILLCRLNGEEEEATILQLPRDTYVEQDGRSLKLNALYGRFLSEATADAVTDPRKTALERMTALLSVSLGIVIDDYMLLDLAAFREVVDAIGGVTLDVPFDLDYDDPEQDLHIHIAKGHQTLNGSMAEQFIRYRAGYVRADLGRVDAQKLFLAALIQRIQEGLSLTEVLAVGESLLTHTTSSLTLPELPGLASVALGMPLSAIRMMTAPGEITNSGRYYVLNREGMTVLLTEAYSTTGRGFDANRLFRGYRNDEIRGLYNRRYEAVWCPDAGTLTEKGMQIAVSSD